MDGFIPIEELNQEHRRINQEENHQLDNAQGQQLMDNFHLHENRQAGAMRAQGQAVGEKWTRSRKDFLKRSLNVKTVKHFPEKSVLTGDYGSKFKSRIKSDIKRVEKQRDKSSRLYKKKENSRLINACEKNVREEAFGKLSEHINMDQKLCDQEDLCDLAAFMDMEKNKAKELIDLFLNENEQTLGTNKQAALDQMLQGILSFNAENIRLDNDTELAKNGEKLESLTWKIAAFDRLSEKYKYFDQLDDDTKKQINDKLDRIRSVSDYYIIRKEIITDPMYKSHYNDELSMDFTRAETPEQTELAKKLLRAHIAGKNMMRKNGASAKLIRSMGEPKFQNQQMAKQYIASQEYVYQSNLEIQSIRNYYITNAPMEKADRIVRLMDERKEAQRLSEQNSIISVKSDAEQEEMENSGNLISSISERQWKQSGGTTYKKVMAKEDADRIVKKSKGFLTAVKTEDGLMEIKQSLPEEVVIKGQKVHLRKAWNLLIKAGVTMVTNEDGSFKTDQESSRRGLLFSHLLSIYRSMDDPREQFEDTLKQEIAPVMEQLLRENYEAKGVVSAKALEEAKKEVKNLCNELLLVLDANHEMSGGLPLIPREAMLGDYVDNMKTFDQVDDEMMENFLKGYKFRENQVVKKIVDGVEISENVIVEREATDEEIKAAVASIRKDIQISNGQLKKVRDIDIDSKVVPIPNTCSANIHFYRNLQKICTGYSDFIEYRPKEYIRKHPLQVLNFLKKNIYLLADANGTGKYEFEKAVKTLNGMTLRESREGLSPEELKEEEKKIKKLASIADRFGKYEFHAAAHIFSDEDDGDMTIEGFAADTSQFMVEPFSLNAGIGQYKGKLTDEPDSMTKNTKKQEGYSKYYSNDILYNADKVQVLKIYLNRVMKEKPDSFPSVMAKKLEDEAKIKRQQEQERLEREERERAERQERERIEREEKERREKEEKERLEREEKEKQEQAKKKFENLPSDPDAMDELMIAQTNDEYFKNKEDLENADNDAQMIRDQGIEEEVQRYTDEEYSIFNSYLRDKTYDEIDEEQKQVVEKLKSGMSKCKINRTVVVNRGTRNFSVLLSMLGLKKARGASDSDIVKQVLTHINECQKAGKDIILTDPGFVSTCYDANNKFIDDRMMPKGIEFVIKVNKGTSAANISKVGIHSDEKELLLNAGTKFRLIKVYNAGSDDIEGAKKRKATSDLINNRENTKKGLCLKIYLETIPNQEDGVLK